MEFVKPGKYVELAYDLFEVDGENESKMVGFTKERPDRIIFGVDDSVIPAFCDAIEGKSAGDTFDITLAPEDAFGPRREEHVMDLDKELFNDEDGKFDSKHVYEGAAITMMTAEGYPVSGLVLSVTPLKVRLQPSARGEDRTLQRRNTVGARCHGSGAASVVRRQLRRLRRMRARPRS